jgi:hypothetical protein
MIRNIVYLIGGVILAGGLIEAIVLLVKWISSFGLS